MFSPAQIEDSRLVLGNEEVMMGRKGIKEVQNRASVLEGFNKPGEEKNPHVRK